MVIFFLNRIAAIASTWCFEHKPEMAKLKGDTNSDDAVNLT